MISTKQETLSKEAIGKQNHPKIRRVLSKLVFDVGDLKSEEQECKQNSKSRISINNLMEGSSMILGY